MLGFLLRIWWIYAVPTEQLFDFATYQEIAVNIANGYGHSYQGQPIAFQGMGYPAALGLLYRLLGSSDPLVGKWFNIALSMASLGLYYRILCRLTANRLIIAVSMTILSLLPNLIAYNNVIGTEVFFNFLLALILFLQLSGFDRRFRYPLLGMAVGAAALTKPFFLAYPILLAVARWLKEKDWRDTVALFLAVSLFMGITVAPWSYRNYQKFGRFIAVSYNGGYVSFINNNANNTRGMWMPLDQTAASPELRRQIEAALQGGRSIKLAHELEPAFQREARAWILSHPWEFVQLGLLRLKITFFSGAWDVADWAMNGLQEPGEATDPGSEQRQQKALLALFDILIHILSSAGFLYVAASIVPLIRGFFSRSRRLDETTVTLSLHIGFFAAVYFVFEGQARYNFPLLPFFAVALASILASLAQSRPEPPENSRGRTLLPRVE